MLLMSFDLSKWKLSFSGFIFYGIHYLSEKRKKEKQTQEQYLYNDGVLGPHNVFFLLQE